MGIDAMPSADAPIFPPRLNFGHLAVFDAVARAVSVGGGAATLMIGQPAASRQVQLLERAVGADLFVRTPKGVRLTAAGEVLADYAAKIFALADEATAAVEDLRGLERGRLRVGASPTIGTYLLPDVLVRFRARFPNVRTRVEVEPRDLLRSRLLAGHLDLGLSDDPDRHDGLTAEPLMVEQFACITPPNHPLAGRRDMTAAEFFAGPLVLRSATAGGASFVQRALRARGTTPKIALSLGSTEAVKRAVSAGLGVAVVPRLSIDLELAAGRLAAVELADFELSRPVHLLRRIGELPTKPQRAFHCLLERVVREL